MKSKNQSKRILNLMLSTVVYPNLRATPQGEYVCIGIGRMHFLDPDAPVRQPFNKVVVVFLEKGKAPSMTLLDEDVFRQIPFYKSVKVTLKKCSNYSTLTMQRGKPRTIIDQIVPTTSGEPLSWSDKLVFRIQTNSHKLISRDGRKNE